MSLEKFKVLGKCKILPIIVKALDYPNHSKYEILKN